MPNVILLEDYSVKHQIFFFFFQTLSFQVEMTCYSYDDKTLGWIWAESYDTCKIHVNLVNPEDMIRASCGHSQKYEYESLINLVCAVQLR